VHGCFQFQIKIGWIKLTQGFDGFDDLAGNFCKSLGLG